MIKTIEKVRNLLTQYGQEHLLMKYDEMTPENQKKLLEMISSIDFELMKALYYKAKKQHISENKEIEPCRFVEKAALKGHQKSCFQALGEETVRDGQLAVVTLAGGQGTRLGFNGPKGAFVFDKENNMSIFEALANTLKEECKMCYIDIPWYIMTSRENDIATKAFFESHNYFGYNKEEVHFFVQDELPMLDFDGKVILDENGFVKFAANGHGGVIYALNKNGIIEELKDRKIEWVSINGVDNVLVQPVDPIFIGMAVQRGVEVATKTIAKLDPDEKVGVVCRKNGKICVVEYTEISKDMAEMRDNDGNLVYGQAYAMFNLFRIDAIEKVANYELPYHVAIKKAEHYHKKNGNCVEEPNSYKFERFLFDAFPMFNHMLVLQTNRDYEFAPIKNARGKDSPETALNLYRKSKF